VRFLCHWPFLSFSLPCLLDSRFVLRLPCRRGRGQEEAILQQDCFHLIHPLLLSLLYLFLSLSPSFSTCRCLCACAWFHSFHQMSACEGSKWIFFWGSAVSPSLYLFKERKVSILFFIHSCLEPNHALKKGRLI